jgi:hypothetical protein
MSAGSRGWARAASRSKPICILAARSSAVEVLDLVQHQTATQRLRSRRNRVSKSASTEKTPAPTPGNALRSHSSGPEQTDSKSIIRYPLSLTRRLPR